MQLLKIKYENITKKQIAWFSPKIHLADTYVDPGYDVSGYLGHGNQDTHKNFYSNIKHKNNIILQTKYVIKKCIDET